MAAAHRTLPLFCLLISAAAAAAAAVPLQSPSSALLAAKILHAKGYSNFAALIVSLSTVMGNFSGTLLAPPDFAFSSASASLLTNRRPPPRPSVSLLLYHTFKPPLILTWPALTLLANSQELPTHFDNNCLYAFPNPYGGGISISTSPYNNPSSAVHIRQPDLYADAFLAVHGVDRVLDPSFATKCSISPPDVFSAAAPRQVNRTLFLEHTIKGLRRTGYHVAAAAMAVRKSELLTLTSVTFFAVSDNNLFLKPNGFRYDFRHHVVPSRLRFRDLASLMSNGSSFLTLAENKSVLVGSVDGAVTVDGVPVEAKEAHNNRWIVVLSISSSLDDVVSDSPVNSSIPIGISDFVSPDQFPSPAPPYVAPVPSPIVSPPMPPVPSPVIPPPDPSVSSPTILTDPIVLDSSTGSPQPAWDWELYWGIGEDIPDSESINISSSISPPPSPATDVLEESAASPAPSTDSPVASPAIEAVELASSLAPMEDSQCVISVGVEGGDLFCPMGSVARRLQEMEGVIVADVDESKPSIADADVKLKISENVNIADDVFFYI